MPPDAVCRWTRGHTGLMGLRMQSEYMSLTGRSCHNSKNNNNTGAKPKILRKVRAKMPAQWSWNHDTTTKCKRKRIERLRNEITNLTCQKWRPFNEGESSWCDFLKALLMVFNVNKRGSFMSHTTEGTSWEEWQLLCSSISYATETQTEQYLV